MPTAVILGGGLAGMASAYCLARDGWKDVTILERGPVLGGLAGTFERGGHFYPLAYHHVLERDNVLLWMLDLLEVLPRVRWRKIRLLMRFEGRLYNLADPRDFLRLPMPFVSKLHFVRLMLRSFRKSDWSDWEGRTAADLVDKWGGRRLRETLFEPLTRLKFELPCSEVSGAWLGARLYFREGSTPLGYVPGANWTALLCDGLTELLREEGVRIRTRANVRGLQARAGRVRAAELEDGERVEGDVFVSALPTEVYMRMLPDDATPRLGTIRYSGLISVVVAARQRVEPDFYWLSLTSLDTTASGIFVLSSLNPTIGAPDESCVNFVTHLNSRERPLFSVGDDELVDLYLEDFRAIFGHDLEPHWRFIARVPMYSPVFGPDFQNPPVRGTTWDNVYFAGNYRTFPSIASTGTALASRPRGRPRDPARARIRQRACTRWRAPSGRALSRHPTRTRSSRSRELEPQPRKVEEKREEKQPARTGAGDRSSKEGR